MQREERVRGAEPGRDGSLLEVRDLVKDFGGLRAIDHCTLSVREGAITGLIGPNGAGKTTLFNVVTGFFLPDAGRVYLDGQDITSLPPHHVFGKKLCRTFQIPREHQTMTVLENLMLVSSDQAGERFWNCWFRPGLVRRQETESRDTPTDCAGVPGIFSGSFACHPGPKTPGYPFRPPGKERGGRTLARPMTASNFPTRALLPPAISQLAGGNPSWPQPP
jgi:ABC-type transport system involved in cytochrome bd biosynthesis fused ATPase/permease subunit